MDDTGVTRGTVIRALRAVDVSVSYDEDDPDQIVTIATHDGEQTDSIPIRKEYEIGRKLLHYLARRYNVPIHWFFNPLMIPVQTSKSIN